MILCLYCELANFLALSCLHALLLQALPTSIQADLEELRHATQRYEAAQDKGSLGLGINILGLKI